MNQKINGRTWCNHCEEYHNIYGIYENNELITEQVACEDCLYDITEAFANEHIQGYEKEKIMRWIDIKKRIPNQEGIYLVMRTFHKPCLDGDKIVRENIPSLSRFSFANGFFIAMPDLFTITHWMNIPPLEL